MNPLISLATNFSSWVSNFLLSPSHSLILCSNTSMRSTPKLLNWCDSSDLLVFKGTFHVCHLQACLWLLALLWVYLSEHIRFSMSNMMWLSRETLILPDVLTIWILLSFFMFQTGFFPLVLFPKHMKEYIPVLFSLLLFQSAFLHAVIKYKYVSLFTCLSHQWMNERGKYTHLICFTFISYFSPSYCLEHTQYCYEKEKKRYYKAGLKKYD